MFKVHDSIFTGLFLCAIKSDVAAICGICAGMCASLKLSGLYIVLLLLMWQLWKKKQVTAFLVQPLSLRHHFICETSSLQAIHFSQ